MLMTMAYNGSIGDNSVMVTYDMRIGRDGWGNNSSRTGKVRRNIRGHLFSFILYNKWGYQIFKGIKYSYL